MPIYPFNRDAPYSARNTAARDRTLPCFLWDYVRTVESVFVIHGGNGRIEKSIAKRIEQSIEKSIEQSIEQSIEKSIEKRIEKSIEKSIDTGLTQD
jgi:hypothetical protein